jgi:hypothetical protein
VPLQIAERERRHREVVPERPPKVVEVDLDGREAVGLHRAVAMRFEIELTESRERDGRAGNLLWGGHLAVVEHELLDGEAERDAHELLLDAEQQVVDLGRLGLGLRLGDLAEGDVVPPAEVAEGELETPVAVLDRRHDEPPRDGATSPQCDRGDFARFSPEAPFAQEKGARVYRPNPLSRIVPKRGLEPPRAWLAH